MPKRHSSAQASPHHSSSRRLSSENITMEIRGLLKGSRRGNAEGMLVRLHHPRFASEWACPECPAQREMCHIPSLAEPLLHGASLGPWRR